MVKNDEKVAAIKAALFVLFVTVDLLLDPLGISAAKMYRDSDRHRVLWFLAVLTANYGVIWVGFHIASRVRNARRRRNANPLRG